MLRIVYDFFVLFFRETGRTSWSQYRHRDEHGKCSEWYRHFDHVWWLEFGSIIPDHVSTINVARIWLSVPGDRNRGRRFMRRARQNNNVEYQKLS